MSRQYYETESDLQRESEIIKKFQEKWKVDIQKLPIKYSLDFAIHRDKKVVAFCEIKTRNMTTETNTKYGGFLLALNKWIVAKNLFDATGLPFILIYRLTDADYYSSITDFSNHKGIFIYPARSDRGDWQDSEPAVRLDVNMFKKI